MFQSWDLPKHKLFLSDRYNYLYFRLTKGRTELPWQEQQVCFHICPNQCLDIEKGWIPLKSNTQNSQAKLIWQASYHCYLADEPFLIPPMFPGCYTIVAQVFTGKQGEAVVERFDFSMDCRTTPPYIWETARLLQSARDQQVKISLTGGTWTTGEWRYLSARQLAQGILSEAGSITLTLTAQEKGLWIPTITFCDFEQISELTVATELEGMEHYEI